MRDNRNRSIRDFLKVNNMTTDTADLHFYGDIVADSWEAWGCDDNYPTEIREFLNSIGDKDLNIYINSCGGSVFRGMAIYNMLKRHKGHKKVIVDGIAASISSVIALVGDEVEIPANAYFMIHKPWCYVGSGNSDDFRQQADSLDKIEDGIVNVYLEHVKEGTSEEDIRNMMAAETWMTGTEASEYFTNISSSTPIKVLNYVDSDIEFKNIRKIPDAVREARNNNVWEKINEEKEKMEKDEIENIMMEIELA